MSPTSDGIKSDKKESLPLTPLIFLGMALLMLIIISLSNISTSWATSLLPGWNNLDTFYSNKSLLIQILMNYWFAYPAVIVGVGGLFFLNSSRAKGYTRVSALNVLGLTFFISSSLVMIIFLLIPESLVSKWDRGGWTLYPPIPQGDNFNSKTIFKGFTYYKILSATPFIALLLNLLGQVLVVLNMALTVLKRGLPDFIKYHSRILKIFLLIILTGFILMGFNLMWQSAVISKVMLFPQTMYDPTRGGDPILFLHISWLTGTHDIILCYWMAGGILLSLLMKDDNRKWLWFFPIILMVVAFLGTVLIFPDRFNPPTTVYSKLNDITDSWVSLLFFVFPTIIFLALSIIRFAKRVQEFFKRAKDNILWAVILFAVTATLMLIMDWVRVGILLGPSVILYILLSSVTAHFTVFFRISQLWAIGWVMLPFFWLINKVALLKESYNILLPQSFTGIIQDNLIFFSSTSCVIYMTIAYLYPGLYRSKWRDILARFHFILTLVISLALVITQIWNAYILGHHMRDLLPTYIDMMEKANDKLVVYLIYGLIMTQLIWLGNLIYGVIRGDLSTRLPQHSE